MIVGIGHTMQVGKDTAATALCRELGFRRIGFADALKRLAFAADPLVTSATRATNIQVGHGRLKHVVQGLGWDEAKNVYPEVRRFLQELGLGMREEFGEEVWVEHLLDKIGHQENVVIPDVRFLNEAEAIRNEGGLLLKILRPGKHGDGHRSETELADFDGWDHVIDNNGSIPELEQKVVQIVRDALPKEDAA